MFTVCPKCALTLVVTAADLRVAQGYVRCGRCSSVFNALAQLSDERGAALAGDSEAPPPKADAEELESPSLAGDGGLGESRPAAAADEVPIRSAAPAASDESKRSTSAAATDDDSVPEYTLEFNPETTDASSLFVVAAPSPEWTAATGSFKALVTPEQPPVPAAPEPKAQDPDEDFEVELDAALLSDIVQSELAAEKPANRPEAPAAASRPATTVSTPSPAAANPPAGAAVKTPADASGKTAPAAGAATLTAATAKTPPVAPASTPPATSAKTPSVTVGATAAAPARMPAPPAARTPPATTGKTSPAAAAAHLGMAAATPAATATTAAPAAKTPTSAPAKTASATETPATPQSDKGPDPHAAAPSTDVAFADFEAVAGAAAQRVARPQWQWAAGSGLLLLILVAQIINHQRDALATDPRFSPSLTKVYTALGVQLTPRWDLRAYDVRQLGATVEAGGTGAITVRASIRNAGTRPQPLPLLRVTLQDRFGNRLASRDVLPRDYAPRGTPSSALLATDQRVDAELAFVDPGASAVGFELDACLPLGAGIICANDTSAR